MDAGRGLDAGNAQNVAAVTFVGAGDIEDAAFLVHDEPQNFSNKYRHILHSATMPITEGTDHDYAQCYNPFWGRHKHTHDLSLATTIT